jgi:hypothetical protein
MGLLTDFLGQPNSDQSQALGLLGAHLMAGQGPQGFLAANQFMAGADDRRLRKSLLDAQLQETLAQADERKLKLAMAQQNQARQDRFLNGDPNGVAAGAFAPSADGFGPVLPQGAAPQAGGLIAQARALGIPESAIQSDVVFNGGKGISDMLFKRGTPSMKVSNGFAYDENRLNAGFLPQLNVSQDGKTSMVQIDPRTGLPLVSAPSGALNTYAGYRNIDESAKANFDPVTVTPQGQNPQMTSRGALMRNPQVQGGIPAGADAGRAEILNQEVTKAQAQLQAALRGGDTTAAQRATNDLTALNRELKALGGTSRATVGMPLQSDAEKTKAVKDAEAESGRDATMQKGAANSRDTLNYIKEARALFKKGPTNSGVGALIDAGASAFGMSTPGADAAAQLDTLSGWMVSNVPRMEGPQSNFDVQNYKTMAGMVGDKTKPLSQRLAALDTLERLQNKYAHLNGGAETNKAPATVAQGAFSDAAKEQRYQEWKRSQGK